MVPSRWMTYIGRTVRFQETLRRLAMIDECFVEDQAGLGLDPAGLSALDPKTTALLQVGVSLTMRRPLLIAAPIGLSRLVMMGRVLVPSWFGHVDPAPTWTVRLRAQSVAARGSWSWNYASTAARVGLVGPPGPSDLLASRRFGL